MAKETTYQRLKKENRELRQELLNLAIHPESKEGLIIKMKYVAIGASEHAIWAGVISCDSSVYFRGFLNGSNIN